MASPRSMLPVIMECLHVLMPAVIRRSGSQALFQLGLYCAIQDGKRHPHPISQEVNQNEKRGSLSAVASAEALSRLFNKAPIGLD